MSQSAHAPFARATSGEGPWAMRGGSRQMRGHASYELSAQGSAGQFVRAGRRVSVNHASPRGR